MEKRADSKPVIPIAPITVSPRGKAMELMGTLGDTRLLKWEANKVYRTSML